jgi:hypothetical protein
MSKATLNAKIGVKGRYRMRIRKPGQAPHIDTGWFDNLITDAGLNLMGTDSGFMTACQVGTDNTAPTNGDTALGARVDGHSWTDFSDSIQSSSPWYGAGTVTYEFDPSASDVNLSEVGVGTATTGGTLFSRALIVDGGGSPTTISLLTGEILEVVYQLQLIPPTGDVVTTVTDPNTATDHEVTLRACDVDVIRGTNSGWGVRATSDGAVELGNEFSALAYTGAIGTIDAAPTGTQDGPGAVVTDAYVDASLERTGTITFGLSDANFAVRSLKFHWRNGGTWQAEFDPVITKDNTQTLAIGVSVTWDRTTAE